MKKIPHEEHSSMARKAGIFLRAAKIINEIKNRDIGSEEVSYYLLSHTTELAIKAIAKQATGEYPRIHDKEKLAVRYKNICNLSDKEINVIRKLKLLNKGPGGLRYPNEPQVEFLPSIFEDNVKLVEKLLEKFKNT